MNFLLNLLEPTKLSETFPMGPIYHGNVSDARVFLKLETPIKNGKKELLEVVMSTKRNREPA